ncbi:DUF72 domain-containing protein [Tautonia rosea]|uniref:DUF72 domain-containing protein n=1 Tax=Tautonia rosea TaxID=2728037 RepID=UPI0014730A95|nr:DUF72 domain-containing protein [Tautonia rosea]
MNTTTTPNPILIGCCGWSYPDWEGVFYPHGLHSNEALTYYADRFPIVEVDSTFYRPPTPGLIRSWDDRTPKDFRFALKVPRSITHEKLLKDCEEEVEVFVSAAIGLGEKLSCVLLQMGYFNRSAFGTQSEFLQVLDRFLARWPSGQVPVAVEVRNARWINSDLASVLATHGAVLTLTEQSWMPTPREVADQLDPLTGPFAFIRLLGDRQGIERMTTTWDRIVLDRSAELAETANVIQSLSQHAPVFVFANNHYAGHSPETVRQLRRFLELPEPSPPDRPKWTLFD